MKKFTAVLLVLMLSFSLILTGCGGGSSGFTGNKDATYTVANVVNGNLGDKSFFDSAEAGLKRLADAGVIRYKTIELGGSDQDMPKWKESLIEVSDSGDYDLVICGTWQMNDILAEVAPKYPDQNFLIYDSSVPCDNVCSINYRQNDMGYIVGAFASALTTATEFDRINQDPVIGFVGGEDGPVINDFLVGYIEGAQSVNPDIKVDVRYVGGFVDSAKGKELAIGMINQSAVDIVWGVAGNAGNGAAEAANELSAWFIGVDSDQELTFTDAQADLAKVTMTSGLKNIGESLEWFFTEWNAGNTHWGEELWLGLEENGVGFVTDKNFKTTPQAVQDAALNAQNQVMSGNVKVSSAFGDNPVDINAIRNSVQP